VPLLLSDLVAENTQQHKHVSYQKRLEHWSWCDLSLLLYAIGTAYSEVCYSLVATPGFLVTQLSQSFFLGQGALFSFQIEANALAPNQLQFRH
jgi:hypothetical protein